MVTRDRSSSYGSAIKEALPEAKQIADYFHLLENLTEKGLTFIRDELPQKIYFTSDYKITKDIKKKEYCFSRKKIESLMYNNSLKKKYSKEDRKMLGIILKEKFIIKTFIEQIPKLKKSLKNGKIKAFESLLKRWKKSKVSVLKTFTKGIDNDLEAVKNAVTHTETNGLAEGKINKIKTMKRMMYGRAKSDLLEARLFLSDYFPQY